MSNSNQNINSDNISEEKNIAVISIPILMYHHIRDYDNPEDKIGTNLSVSPQEFINQLNLIENKGYKTVTFEEILNNHLPDKPIILTFDDGYLNFYQNAYPELKKRNLKAASYIITNSIGGGAYMNSNQIKEISNNGIEIGSHTISHPDLSKLSNEKAEREIFESKKILEVLLNKKIVSFCYPSGKYDETTKELVKDAGYSYAVTTNGGIAKLGSGDYELNRYRVNKGTDISRYLK